MWTNSDAIHRHACHAFEDFELLRKLIDNKVETLDEVLHSISHHLRHVVYRSGHEVSDDRLRIDTVRRSHVSNRHE